MTVTKENDVDIWLLVFYLLIYDNLLIDVDGIPIISSSSHPLDPM
jgi:hypothetical protein